MRFHASFVASALLVSVSVSVTSAAAAFVPLKQNVRSFSSVKSSSSSTAMEETKSLTYNLISKLQYRAVQRELLERDLDASGTLSSMRNRLREVSCDDSSKDADENCIIDEAKLATVSICVFHVYFMYCLALPCLAWPGLAWPGLTSPWMAVGLI
jgi:hypothetical protein